MPPKLNAKRQGDEDDLATLNSEEEDELEAELALEILWKKQKTDHDVLAIEAPASSASRSTADDCDSEDSDNKRFKLSLPDHSGTLIMCGGVNWDMTGRKKIPVGVKEKHVGIENLWGPQRLKPLSGVKVSVVVSGCCACHSVLITKEGKAMTWGRNDRSQLGHGDTSRKNTPTLVDALKDETIVSAACGRSHTLFLNEQGVVYSCGENKMGQCGNGVQKEPVNIPSQIKFGRPVSKVACGAEFSVIVDFKGHVLTFGSSEHGQLGHNTDGRYFITASKIAFSCELVPRRICLFIEKSPDSRIKPVKDVCITDVVCGANHTVALDSKKRCFSWGFGGYGRLGHADTQNEMVPRLIKSCHLLSAAKIFAGGSFSMAVDPYDVLYFWGQTRLTGEATMYPKPVYDITGWHIKDVGCSNKSIVVVGEDKVAAWGPTPTYGELGYGDGQFKIKSSAIPLELEALEGFNLHSVSCGFGHTLYIAADESEKDQKLLDKLPEFAPR